MKLNLFTRVILTSTLATLAGSVLADITIINKYRSSVDYRIEANPAQCGTDILKIASYEDKTWAPPSLRSCKYLEKVTVAVMEAGSSWHFCNDVSLNARIEIVPDTGASGLPMCVVK